MTLQLKLARLDQPAVSIAVCNYNNADFLVRAIESALYQTVKCEVVVIDDGSTDNSLIVANEWLPRVKVVSKSNGGQVSAYQRAFDETTGDVLIFLDSDDFLLPDAAQVVSNLFDEGVSKVHFRLSITDKQGCAVGIDIPSSYADGDVLAPMLSSGVLYACAPGSGNAYRRQVLQALFPLPEDPQDPHGADLFLVYGSVFFGKAVAVDKSMGGYRVHWDSASQAKSLTFGNAEQKPGAKDRFYKRLDRFRHWIDERTGKTFDLPDTFLDFGNEKVFFVKDVLEGRLSERIKKGWTHAPLLLRSIWRQPSYPFLKKVALSSWAALVVILPTSLAFPIARYVCNPMSRGR